MSRGDVVKSLESLFLQSVSGDEEPSLGRKLESRMARKTKGEPEGQDVVMPRRRVLREQVGAAGGSMHCSAAACGNTGASSVVGVGRAAPD